MPRADDGGHHAPLEDLALFVNGHEAGQGEPRNALVERADVVGERGGEHGKDTVGEIDARAARICLVVDDAVPFDIVGDVRDVHAQIEFSVFLADGDGIVDVARVLAVHGDDELVPEIDASRKIVEGGAQRLFFGGVQDLFGELLFEVMGADERFFLDEEVAALAEHFDDLARGHAPVKGADVRNDLCPARSALAAVARDEDIG